MTADQLNQSRQNFERSVATLSKAKSHASVRLNKLNAERAVAFNTELTVKLSYSWK